MSSLRTRGGSGALTGSAAFSPSSSSSYSSTASTPSSATRSSSSSASSAGAIADRWSSDGSSTINTEQRRAARGRPVEDGGQEVVGHEDRREQAGQDSDREHDREALDRRGTDEEQ